MENGPVRVRRALLSASDKSGLVEFASALSGLGVELVSTGGTAAALRAAGTPVVDVAEVTGFPEMLEGRVKTLHPAIHGGILADSGNPAHAAAIAAQGIVPIDLVAVTLYPFAEVVAAGAGPEACVENIDIGGPAMLRAAAKNHARVLAVSDPADYAEVIDALRAGEGTTFLEMRRRYAARAYAQTAAYETAVADWCGGEWDRDAGSWLRVAGRRVATLRYGENPHQAAAVYAAGPGRPGALGGHQLQGKPLSYNNLQDADAAFEAACEFDPAEGAACVIVKHATPSGAALAPAAGEAFRRARAADETSAFGGVVAFSTGLDAAAAAAVVESYFEVVIAPAVGEEAVSVLASRPGLRVLVTGGVPDRTHPPPSLRSLAGGVLLQEADRGRVEAADLRAVTRRAPSEEEVAAMLFAWRIAKHARSNAIVLARGGVTLGIGSGRTSRVDAVRGAVAAAGEAAAGAVLASDGFFPFADGVEVAAAAGIGAVIQPGGSIRDEEVIAAADAAGLAMVFTGMRHFRH